jgi:hypothetical protein
VEVEKKMKSVREISTGNEKIERAIGGWCR